MVLTDLDDFEQSFEKALEMLNEIPSVIGVQNKIQTVINNVRTFLAD